jgi:hypothetical protein
MSTLGGKVWGEIFARRKNLVPPGFVLGECDGCAIPT